MAHKNKMLLAGAALAAMMGFTAPATAADGPEIGYAGGALAVDDITQGRLIAAERVLQAQSAEDARDPARLINLGLVYARTGRSMEAQAAFLAARAAPEKKLILADGRELSSRKVADEALAWLGAQRHSGW